MSERQPRTRLRTGLLAVVVGLVAATLVPGCEALRGLGEQCDVNSQCDHPLACHLSRCRRQCASVRDCPIGALCVPTNAGHGVCLLPDEMGCGHDSDCRGELVCREGRCANACTSDGECAAGARCGGEAVGTRACVDPTMRMCEHDSECGDLFCVRGRCADQCIENRDCREGTRCVGGACVLEEPPPAMDAGAPDAGSSDAGPPDAGPPPLDSGASDAGPGDAGPPVMDAGATDAGEDASVEVVLVCEVPGDCAAPGVVGADCVEELCVATACEGTLADCNGEFGDGCEVDTATDPRHCGACERFCGYGISCGGGSCEGGVSGLSLGEDHLCAQLSNGRVVCMGADGSGQLGVGSEPVTEPTPVLGLEDAVSVANGIHTSCAVRASGEAACWGYGRRGQIGEGRFTDRHSPRPVSGLTGVAQIGVGQAFACARLTSGEVSCWGDNQVGQLGDGSVETSNVPVSVTGITDAIDLAVGYRFACALRATGVVMCWGHDAHGQLGNGSDAVQGCPVGADAGCSTTPVVVSGLDEVIDVEAGGHTVFARRSDGSVWVWGRNNRGNFGLAGADPPAEAHAPIAGPDLSNVAQLAVGVWHVCARHTDGTVSCWGDGGRIGDGTDAEESQIPVTVADLSDATHVTVDVWTSCALRASGGPVCWGYNDGAFGVDHRWDFLDRPLPLPSSFP